MYQIEEVIKEIYKTAPRVVNMSLDEWAEEIEKRTGVRPVKSAVKAILNKNGIVAKEGKKRVWVYRHNGGKKE